MRQPSSKITYGKAWAGLLLVAVMAGVLGIAGGAHAQRAGFDQFLIRPPTVALATAMAPARLAQMLEVPVHRRLLGLPSVKYSFGEFLLLERGTLPMGGNQNQVYETPSDQGHASTNPAGLNWSDFQHCLWLMTPVKDQGQRGSCHAMAATGLMEALLKLKSAISGEPVNIAGTTYHINEEIDLSVEWLEYAAKKRAHGAANQRCGDGGDPAYDLETVRQQGHVPESFWRYNPQHWFNDPAHASMVVGDSGDGPWNWKVVAQTTDGNPPWAVQQAIAARNNDPAGLLTFGISNLHQGGDHDTGLNYIKSMVNSGRPVVVSVPWPTGRMIANGCVLYVPDLAKDRSEAQLWADTESSGGKMVSKWFRGGHCIMVMGIGRAGTPAEGLYAFKNSWSRWWGKDGYGFFTEAYLKKFLGQTVFCDV
jgi:hypothetical protein